MWNLLTALGGFQVTARTSSEQYRQSTKSPQLIGKELGVDYLLGATVVWDKSSGGKGRVQVSPELIEVRTGASKWQQSFDASVTDVFVGEATSGIGQPMPIVINPSDVTMRADGAITSPCSGVSRTSALAR